MQKYDLSNATSQEKREVLLKIRRENPGLSIRRIASLTGISKSSVFYLLDELDTPYDSYFTTEKELEDFIKENPTIIFGEVIQWSDFNTILTEGGGRDHITPDITGTASDGSFVIVEVKTLKSKSTGDERKAVGQILHYLHAAIYSMVQTEPNEEQLNILARKFKLFIVSDRHSSATDKICNLLQAHGINIRYISIESLPQAI